jgi:hypothetical protein
MAFHDDLLSIAKFLDDARWSKPENYEIIAHTTGFSYREITLLHYLLYIMDRQMPYEIIWNKGSLIFSQLVRDYCAGKPLCDLLDVKSPSSYVRYTNGNDAIEFYIKNKKEEVTFKSRFMSTDYKSIYSTLYVLDKIANRDLITFCEMVVQAYIADSYIIRRLAYALHLMTYEHPARLGTALSAYLAKTKIESNEIYQEIDDYIKPSVPTPRHSGFCSYDDFCKDKTYNSKRLWCSIRDYIMSPVYSKAFLPAINAILAKYGKGKIQSYTNQLELPGDVWNNNSNFVQCVCNGISKAPTTPFNKFLREKIYSASDDIACFDVSFSLVPRICDGNLDCASCPFGLIKVPPLKHNIVKMCVNDTSKWCPIVLYSTGYKMDCVGKCKCKLMKLYLANVNGLSDNVEAEI